MISTYVILILSAYISAASCQCEYSSTDGDYKAFWWFDKLTNSVTFRVVAKQKSPTGFWTAIGFGNGMSGGDIILINTVGSQVSVTDRHGVGYSEPVLDTQQDVRLIKGVVENGIITVEFNRLVHTGDAQDVDLIDSAKNGCQDFIFPEGGGSSPSLQHVQKHSVTPTIKRICHLDACPGSAAVSIAVTSVPSAVDQSRVQPGAGAPVAVAAAAATSNQPAPAKPQIEPVVAVAAPTPQAPAVGIVEGQTPPLVETTNVPANAELAPCPRRIDHRACRNYTDTYLDAVFKTFERNDKNFGRACSLLLAHQNGLVRRECCHYLAQANVCGRFMSSSEESSPQPVQNPEQNRSAQAQPQPQPQQAPVPAPLPSAANLN